MADTQLVLAAEERDYLQQLLESALRNDLLEEHRTDRFAYRELVQKEIKLVENLLTKVKQTAS